MNTKLHTAFRAWAAQQVNNFQVYGKPEGQVPEDWCGDSLFESILEDEGICDALAELANEYFLTASKE